MVSRLHRRDNETANDDGGYQLPVSPLVPMPITMTLVILGMIFVSVALYMTYKDSLRHIAKNHRKKYLAAMSPKERRAYKVQRAQEIVDECHRHREDDWDLAGVKCWPDDIPVPEKEANRLWNWRLEGKDKFEVRKKKFAKDQNLRHFFRRVIDGGPYMFAQARHDIECFPLFIYHELDEASGTDTPLQNHSATDGIGEFWNPDHRRNSGSSSKTDEDSARSAHRLWII